MQPSGSILWRVRTWLGLTRAGPWRAKSLLLALLVMLVGGGFWLRDVITVYPSAETGQPAFNEIGQPTTGTQFDWSRPLPGYVRFAASFAGAFFIGWLFRRVLVIVAAVLALTAGLLVAGQWLGWDTRAAREQARETGERVQREVVHLRERAQGWLPTAAAGGLGAFLGFRRRHREVTGTLPTA
jgi:hypothetical protein